MNQLLELLRGDWQVLVDFSPRLIAAAIVLFAAYLIGKYFGKLIITVVRRASVKEIHEAFLRAATVVLSMFLGSIVAFNILGLEKLAVSILAGGGVTAVILGFAFREVGENFLAGIFLAFSRPFKIGDLIKSEDLEGYVEEIELRYTHLRTEDGTDVYVPSSQLFGRPVVNYTKDGLRRIGFTVGIDYAIDASEACALLVSTIQRVPGVLADPKSSVHISALSSQVVNLQAYFWIDVFKDSNRAMAIQTEVLDRCRKALLEEGYTANTHAVSGGATAN